MNNKELNLEALKLAEWFIKKGFKELKDESFSPILSAINMPFFLEKDFQRKKEKYKTLIWIQELSDETGIPTEICSKLQRKWLTATEIRKHSTRLKKVFKKKKNIVQS